MTFTLIATQTGTVPAAGGTITPPAGVTSSHLGVIVYANANTFTTAETVAISGWTSRAANPAAGQNMNWTVLTNLGGSAAGTALTVATSGTTTAGAYWAAWYDTGGLDIQAVSTPSGRGGTSQSTVAITGLTTSTASQNVIIISSERTTATGTVISSWSPSAPTQDLFLEDTTGTAVSTFIGHFVQATAGATGTYTSTYNSGSGNGVGMMLLPDTVPSNFSGSASLSGAGTVAPSGSNPKPTGSPSSMTGSGPLSTSAATPKAVGSAGTSGAGGLATSAAKPALVASAALSGSGSLAGVTINSVTLGGDGGLTVVGVGTASPGAFFTGDGGLTADGFQVSYTFTGPVIYDYRPFQIYPPTRLVAAIPYGQTVWRDATTGVWSQQYAPSLDQLATADLVYAGGRVYPLTYDDVVVLVNAGYAAYVNPPPVGITPTAPPPSPGGTPTPPPTPSNTVDTAVVGTATAS